MPPVITLEQARKQVPTLVTLLCGRSTRGFTVGLWRDRFIAKDVAGLGDEPRPGAPREIGAEKIGRLVRPTLEKAPRELPTGQAVCWRIRPD